jgi:hypothetical protein
MIIEIINGGGWIFEVLLNEMIIPKVEKWLHMHFLRLSKSNTIEFCKYLILVVSFWLGYLFGLVLGRNLD